MHSGGGEERRITTPPTNPAAHSVVIITRSACTLAQSDEVPPFGIGALADLDPNSRELIEHAQDASPTTDMV